MFTFLLVVQAIIAASLVGVILMQRSEGGGLGMGGSPSGLMSARGAADFLTRATAVLATLFVVMSIALAALASVSRGSSKIDTSLARPEAQPMAPVGAPNPLGSIPGPGLGGAPGVPAPAAALPAIAPAPGTPESIAPALSGGRPASSADETTNRGSSASERRSRHADGSSPAEAGSAKSGTTPTASASDRTSRTRTPALDVVPLRQSPKVGTLAPAEPSTPSPSAPSPSTSSAAPSAKSGTTSSGASGGGGAAGAPSSPPATTAAPPGNSDGQ